MQVIEAALAFAITMLVLSIVCSTLVETIHRIFGMREAGFRKMLGELFDQVLAPYAGSNPTAKEEFQRRMSALRSPVGLAPALKAIPRTFWAQLYDWVATIWRGRGLSELTSVNFMERLGADVIGRNLVASIPAPAPPVGGPATVSNPVLDRTLQDVAQKFEAFGKEASVFFQRRARLLSVVVAMLVAFSLHVDAIDLFSTLMRNPDARAALIATQDDVLRQAKKAEADAAKAINAKAAPPENLEQLTNAAKDQLKEMRDTEARLRDLGVPIGWTEKRIEDAAFWRWWSRDTCEADGKKPTRVEYKVNCAANETKVVRIPIGIPGNGVLYLGLILGGLLTGLGGPFWSDAIGNMTKVRDAARQIPGLQAPAPVAPPAPAGEPPTPQPRTPVDAFKVSH